MAKEVVILTHDDFDGSIDASTVSFGWQGTDYEIDLTEVHTKEFEEAIRPYLERARQVQPAKGPKRTKTAPRAPYARAKARKLELARIRDWAAAEGFRLTGARVPYEIHRAYNKAHPNDQVPLADGGKGTSTSGGHARPLDQFKPGQQVKESSHNGAGGA